MATSDDPFSENSRIKRPATTPEEREMQLAAKAYDLAERQLDEGTASAMVITHFLKAMSTKQKLEEQKLRKENLLTEARVKQIDSAQNDSELLLQVMDALRVYSGDNPEGTNEDYDE